TLSVGIWDTTRGSLRRRMDGFPSGGVRLAFTPDNKTLVETLPSPNWPIRIWEVASGKERLRFGKQERPYQRLTVSPTSRFLATESGDGLVRLWDLATGTERLALAGHSNPATALAFSGDGRFLVSGSADSMALVWNASGLDRRFPLPAQDLTPQQLDALWSDLASKDAEKAYRAIWLLTAAARQSLPVLLRRLQPEKQADPLHVAPPIP